ncbi:right-handed parallel beta-helix repeat-containing protein [Tenggerimyces flavus]|uniref:Right-handed parallel beta-helix repeat-containing protein n=1 Tax=Tenggerimyces flavus TaxID=1708749 RepID=A0ABV7Y8U8_9ACTN|nr:right-handed parallel beta-helix repeat-containing protein [Tenggerimyces flavus]MBM7791046.1 hypothetical protein [Tenggerimyces flavus]
MRRMLVVLAALASLLVVPLPSAAADCFGWSGQLPLRDAVSANACVQVAPGVWDVDDFVVVPAGHTVRGTPGGDRSATVLRAVQPWENTVAEGILNDDGSNGAPFVVADLTLESGGLATSALCCRGFTARNVVLQGARCYGLGIAGVRVDVTDSLIRHNGAWSGCPSPPGAGVYVVSTVAGPSNWAPRIANTTIRDNTGPGLDIASVWGGQLIGNTIVANTNWAGISLFGSHWLIEGNTVRHPATNQGQPYQRPCASGPSGERSAAIMLCQLHDTDNDVTTDNVVRGNAVSSWYGILLVGNDETRPYWAPRTNTVENNDVTGSVHGCADDFRPGQWFSDQNTWTGNNCSGSPNSGPSYF